MTRRDVIKSELREAARCDVGHPVGVIVPVLYPAVHLGRFPLFDGEPRCRVCGCTEVDCSDCTERTGQPCFWVEPDRCSACTDRIHDTGDDGASDIEDEWCELCHGSGSVTCHCGGDLCVCENHGEEPCPRCAWVMHAAKLARSARLQRVLEVLRDGREHSTQDLVLTCRVCAVNSIIAELRQNGYVIDCRQAPGEHGRVWLYRLSREPSSAETLAPIESAGSAGCPLPAGPGTGASAGDGWRLTPSEEAS